MLGQDAARGYPSESLKAVHHNPPSTGDRLEMQRTECAARLEKIDAALAILDRNSDIEQFLDAAAGLL